MGRVAALVVFCASAAHPHDAITTKLTWTREISRIVYRHCITCHRDGGSAMPLMTYEEARPWAKAIKEEVLERRMPPWGAVKGFGDFRHDISLTQEQINLIAEWVEGGAPEGDRAYEPAVPVYSPEPAQTIAGGLLVNERLALKRPAQLLGIRPLAGVVEAQVIATKPDGSVQPLIWLRNYRQEWQRSFLFRNAVVLPAGTVITVQPAAKVALITATPKRER